MNVKQELIDYLLGELDDEQAAALRARIAADPALEREMTELSALFTFMQRGEDPVPALETRATVLRAAARATRPGVLERVAQFAALARYRFRHSRGFRIATVSVGVHLVAMGVLFLTLGLAHGPAERDPFYVSVNGDDDAVAVEQPLVPGGALVARLEQRRLPHGPRLRLFGVDGQEEAISRGLDALLASQAEDGAFGSARATAEAALALLAEGDCSVQRTPRGRAVRGAVDRLFHDVDGGAAAAPILAALVEDYALGAA
jgi:anti-sigma factor RsiW